MYPLSPLPTAGEVILRSATCHPSLYAEALADQCRTLAEAAITLDHNAEAAGIVLRYGEACAAMAMVLANMEAEAFAFYVVDKGADYWEAALVVAARLQCLPVSVSMAAGARQRAATATHMAS